ncbi:MAG: SDR family NAD(P)-dependent oxidoreductase, partial [Oscillospiraceae bacterium]|nr:SDR family NAD(P)-dependent oxidoreductase [Oscillospiraceae bacterium]
MFRLFDLSDKTAVVIGGAGGLGQAIAQGLVEAGANVLISSRKEESLKKAVGELKAATGLAVDYFAADATNEAQTEALLADAIAKFGKIDILVNAQGFNKKQDALDFDIDVFRQMLDANITSFMISAKHFGRHF